MEHGRHHRLFFLQNLLLHRFFCFFFSFSIFLRPPTRPAAGRWSHRLLGDSAPLSKMNSSCENKCLPFFFLFPRPPRHDTRAGKTHGRDSSFSFLGRGVGKGVVETWKTLNCRLLLLYWNYWIVNRLDSQRHRCVSIVNFVETGHLLYWRVFLCFAIYKWRQGHWSFHCPWCVCASMAAVSLVSHFTVDRTSRPIMAKAETWRSFLALHLSRFRLISMCFSNLLFF